MVLEHRNLSRMLEVAIVAARLGGQRAMEEVNYIKASQRKGNELVTESDRRCQDIIIERIKENYPDHGFLAEEGPEGKLFKLAPRGDEPVWWIIDPIDGTNNFAHRILCFAVSVAVMYQGRTVAAVVFDPATDSMFTAVKDSPAQFNTSRIDAGAEAMGQFASVAIDSHWQDNVPAGIIELIYQTRYRNFGTLALHLAYVAKAGLAGLVGTTAKLWDIAAGAFIAETAGAVVTDWRGNGLFPIEPETYNGENFEIVAANKKAHKQILEKLEK